SDAGTEELGDLDHQRLVAIVAGGGAVGLLAEGDGMVGLLAAAGAAEGPDAAAVPDAGDGVGAIRVRSPHRYAAGAHDGEEHLDAVNAVPEQVRMVRLQGARTLREATEDF